MSTHRLDEIECDEIYHALMGRKSDLEKRMKDLDEKDGLPEAAQAVRDRLELYSPNGTGKNRRPGLVREFAPQGDIDTEAKRKDEERDSNGQQDAFGGGAETGGRPKRTRGKKGGKGENAEKQPDEPPAPRVLTTEQVDALARLESIGEIARALELVRIVAPLTPAAEGEPGTPDATGEAIQVLEVGDRNGHALGEFLRAFVNDTRESAGADAAGLVTDPDAILADPEPVAEDETPAPVTESELSFAEPGTEPGTEPGADGVVGSIPAAAPAAQAPTTGEG